ncbi:MAG: Spy/CpxP family protein refolding chaperone [Flavobacteriales bacterium]|nr:Spy/CpxP family protein refolding chaperone [Flavobacteriales bacterium]
MRTLLFRTLPLAATLLIGSLNVNAQDEDMPPPSGERLKEIKAQKSAYITSRLELTPEQAQQFWPIYNEMDEKQDALRKEMRELHKSAKGDSTLTEAEASQILDKALQTRQKELDLERTYSERFKKSIGAVKTLKLKKAERDFNKEVLKRFRDRMEERKGPGGDGQRHRR